MVTNTLLLVGVFALLSTLSLPVSSQDQPKEILFESFNVERDAGWVLRNYNLLMDKQKDYRFEMIFRDNFYTTLDDKGEAICNSGIAQNHEDYCRIAYSMQCAEELFTTQIGLLKCYFTSDQYYQDKQKAIYNCLPNDPEVRGKYEDCLGFEGEYKIFLAKDYSRRYFEKFAAYGRESTITFDSDGLVPSMKAYYDLDAYLSEKPLLGDDQKLDQDQCDNNYEVENIIKPCQVAKPVVQIFYEAEDPNNKNIFSAVLEQTIKDYPILKFVSKFQFVPYGKTQKQADNTYKCATEEICKGNKLLACTDKFLMDQGPEEPINTLTHTCLANSGKNTADGIKDCITKLYPKSTAYDKIETCVKENQDILEKYRGLTEALKVTTFPSVYIGTEQVSIAASDNLVAKICDNIKGIKPRDCKQVGKTAVTEAKPNEVVIYYNGEKAESVNWVHERMLKLMQTSDEKIPMRRYMNIRFVPFGDLEVNDDGTCSNMDYSPNCLASRIVACAQNVYPDTYPGARADKARVPSFLNCFYSKQNWQTEPMLAAIGCVDKLSNSDVYPWILQCAKQEAKQNIWLSGQTETNKTIGEFSGLSRVTFNGKLLDSGVDFLNTACAMTYDPMPTDCNLLSSSAISLLSSVFTILISLLVIVLY